MIFKFPIFFLMNKKVGGKKIIKNICKKKNYCYFYIFFNFHAPLYVFLKEKF